jgi:hypothetical protein
MGHPTTGPERYGLPAVLLLAAAVATVGGSGAAQAGGETRSPSAATEGARLAQLFRGGGTPGGGAPLGERAGEGQGPQFGGGPQQAQGTRQGGAFPTGTTFALQPGGSVRLAAVCTELLADPPDATTRFDGGRAGSIEMAGQRGSLAAGLQAGLVSISGVHLPGSLPRRANLLLTLEVRNHAQVPVSVAIPAGTEIGPRGQRTAPLPEPARRVFALAERAGIGASNVVQLAVWALRGSTAEDVEHATMSPIGDRDLRQVQLLLDEAGASTRFDRDRGASAGRYAKALATLGESAIDLAGTAVLPRGGRARVVITRDGAGRGVAVLRPAAGGEYFYGTEEVPARAGGLRVRLLNLTSGRPLRLNGSTSAVTLQVTPA